MTVLPHSRDDTVGDLAAALGGGRSDGLVIDGQPAEHFEPLIRTVVQTGSRIDVIPDGARADPGVHASDEPDPVACGQLSVASEPPAIGVAVVVGPDCRATTALADGRHIIGRSPSAHVRIEDPTIELHQVMIDVSGPNAVVTQITGRTPVLLDGAALIGTQEIRAGATLTVGSSELQIRPAPGFVPDDVGDIDPKNGNDDDRGIGSLVDRPHDPWRRAVHRGAASLAAGPTVELTGPVEPATEASPPATGLIGAVVAVIGAGFVAIVLGQMMFALFALIGAVASFATWLAAVATVFRRNRRERRRHADDHAAFVVAVRHAHGVARAAHCDAHAGIERTLAIAESIADGRRTRSAVWRRRLHTSAGDRVGELRVVIGRGDHEWRARLIGDETPAAARTLDAASTLIDVPIPLVLPLHDVVAFRGPIEFCDALVRSVVAQLAVHSGPADWQLVIVTDRPESWQWARWLPHCRADDGRRLIATTQPGGSADGGGLRDMLEAARRDQGRTTLLIVDDLAQLATRTSALRRFIETTAPATIVVAGDVDTVPAACRQVVTVGATGTLRVESSAAWVQQPGEHSVTSSSGFGAGRNIRGCGVSIARADRVARTLAALVDPELDEAGGSSMATSIALGDVDDVIAGACGSDGSRRSASRSIAGRWAGAGKDPAPRGPIGRSADGVVEVDLVRDGPHALIAGTTGSGKSELLRTLVLSLALRLSPDRLTFVLIDYKGGSTFDACADLPHTVGVVTDLDAGLAERALVSLDAELHRRERLLRDVGATDLSDYRRHAEAQPLPRLVVVIDEFAALAKELPDFLAALVGVAQRGRSLGLHLILATQRPTGVVSDEIRANTNLRLALRLNDNADAHDVVGDHRPATFARGVPGRCALRLGPDELVVFQAAQCAGPARRRAGRLQVREADAEERVDSASPGARALVARSELEVAAALVADAAALAAIEPPYRPWTEPLPAHATPDDVDVVAGCRPHDAIGVIDDPATQSRLPLRWHRTAGNLALVGSLGSGTTSALVSLITARCRVAAPSDEHWYVVDARGDSALDGLVSIAHCGGLIRVRERERLHRVLARLDEEIDRRAGDECVLPTVTLAIDGLSSLRTALGSIDDTPTLALLDRVLSDGPPAGVVACWTDDGPTTMLAASPAETWVFHLDDGATARSLGVTPVPVDVPGRMRVASTNCEAQVALGADGVAALPDRSVEGGPPSVAVLPSRVSPSQLRRSPPRRAAGPCFAVGLSCDDLTTAVLTVPPGDHILIGGASATGKSSALGHLSAEWRRMHPRGNVLEVDRRHLPTEALLADDSPDPSLIVVDDADRIGDPDGRLAAIIAEGRPQVLIIAAARLDAVRAGYGHWTRDVARSHCGLVLTSAGDVDGDVLGATLPRRSLIPSRPGLAWLIDSTGHRLVQVAIPDA